MPDNAVAVDRSASLSNIQYSPVFNVAVPFIDRHILEGRSSKTAIRTAERDISYGELAQNVNRCGNLLRSLGASGGDRVLMVVKDCPEFFYLFWGAIKAGLTPVPVNTLLRSGDYQYMLEDSTCAVLVYSPEYAREVEPAMANATHKPGSVMTSTGPDSLRDLIAQQSDQLEAIPASADDDCFWLYSSGSTGRPKGAVHRHRDMVETCVHYAVDTLGITENDICFSAAKLFFAYGLGNSMTFPLWVGATTVLSDQRPSPDMTFEVFDQFKPTLYFGVPTLYATQLRAMDEIPPTPLYERGASKTVGPDLSSIRACVSAGEALPADIIRRWREKTGLTILDGIGSTEALHIFISNRADDFSPGSSGRLVPSYDAKIVDEAGVPVAQGEIGRLLVRGGSMAAYYWNNPEKTAETMVGEWVNTGDTYLQDEAGYYVYCGRSDDMLKVGGIWCSPVEIENCLIEHPKVLEAAIVGRADNDQLIKPEAYIVLTSAIDSQEALSQELLTHCRNTLARYKFPRWFNYVDDLPKTATGKIQRFKLRQT
jgi:benzoate-CoA ligase family protein